MGEESFIWTEKYRPHTLKDVRGQEEIIRKLKAFVEQKNLPHLLFAGAPGTGKSTSALALAQDLFGETWRQNFLELNASDERGIDVVRTNVKDFARTKALGDVPFKIIFLDECDALTREAQQALRRTMENFTNTTRFLLSCNYVSKIIEPVQSRCVVFKFKPLPSEVITNLAKEIANNEKIEITEEGLKALMEVSEGDCRKLGNILQSCAAVERKITRETVYSLASIAKPIEIKETIELALSGNFIASRTKLIDLMLKYGLSGLDVLKQFQKEIWTLNITDRGKVSIVDKIGEAEFRLVEGSDDVIQIEALLAHITLHGGKQ